MALLGNHGVELKLVLGNILKRACWVLRLLGIKLSTK